MFAQTIWRTIFLNSPHPVAFSWNITWTFPCFSCLTTKRFFHLHCLDLFARILKWTFPHLKWLAAFVSRLRAQDQKGTCIKKPLGVVKPSRNSWGEPPNKLSWKPRGQHDQVVIALVVAAVAAILVLVLSLAAVIVIPFPSR